MRPGSIALVLAGCVLVAAERQAAQTSAERRGPAERRSAVAPRRRTRGARPRAAGSAPGRVRRRHPPSFGVIPSPDREDPRDARPAARRRTARSYAVSYARSPVSSRRRVVLPSHCDPAGRICKSPPIGCGRLSHYRGNMWPWLWHIPSSLHKDRSRCPRRSDRDSE